jgi:cytochrome c biogenesis protein CcdA
MILFLLAYLGGVLTIVSPCILPVIPFVLARADRPFLRNGLPMLIGMALAFANTAAWRRWSCLPCSGSPCFFQNWRIG